MLIVNSGSGLSALRSGRLRAAAALLFGLVLVLCLAPATRALAQSSVALYYETETHARTLAIEKLDLTGPRTKSQVVGVGHANIFGIALGGGHVYWTVEAGSRDRGSIMLASFKGGKARRFVGDLTAPASLVSVHGFLYWSDEDAIGRVALNGGRLQRRFIVLPRETGGGVADGLTSDGTHLFFSRCLDHAIGRVDLNGSHLVRGFISNGSTSCPQGLAAAGGHLYWTELGSGVIGRATVGGREVERRWLDVHTDQGPFQIVADTAHIYWTWGGVAGSPAYTGRASANGSHPDPRFLFDSIYPLALSAAVAIS